MAAKTNPVSQVSLFAGKNLTESHSNLNCLIFMLRTDIDLVLLFYIRNGVEVHGRLWVLHFPYHQN